MCIGMCHKRCTNFTVQRRRLKVIAKKIEGKLFPQYSLCRSFSDDVRVLKRYFNIQQQSRVTLAIFCDMMQSFCACRNEKNFLLCSVGAFTFHEIRLTFQTSSVIVSRCRNLRIRSHTSSCHETEKC